MDGPLGQKEQERIYEQQYFGSWKANGIEAVELSDMRRQNLKPAMGRTHNVTGPTATKVRG